MSKEQIAKYEDMLRKAVQDDFTLRVKEAWDDFEKQQVD